jgi:hypothetical protein
MQANRHAAAAAAMVGAVLGLMALSPATAFADDIDYFDENVVVTHPQEEKTSTKARSLRSSAPASSQTGTWVEVKRSEGDSAIQTCEYYINPTPNSDGSVQVQIRTKLYCKSGSAFWTTTKTIYDNGSQCSYISEDWNAIAYPGETISQQASFAVKGGGSHHITSIETIFRYSAGTQAGWDFYINIPYRISASAAAGGSISPNGHNLINAGDSKTYTVTPASGYRIKDVLVDGKSAGVPAAYTFSNVQGDHTITASFQKVWTVTYVDGVTGEKLGEEVVDEGASANPPTAPSHEGWGFDGWSGSTSNIKGDTTVTATYSPVIAVRIPTELPCRILADGTVVVPSDYAIENLSVVDVRASSISTTNAPSDATIQISEGDTLVHSWDGSDHDGEELRIAKGASQELKVSVSPVTGDGEWRAVAQNAAIGITDLCQLNYSFEWAK